VLAGLDSGARVALVVGARCREAVGGYALLSYPLTGLPAAAGGLAPPAALLPLDHGALAAAGAPALFVSSASDPRAPAAALIDLASRLPPATTRVVLAAAVDAAFSDPSTRRLEADAFLQLATAIIDFAAAVDAGAPHGCQLPGPSTVAVPAAMARKVEAPPPSGGGGAASAASPGASDGGEAMDGAPDGAREHSMPLELALG
jgi:pimeloyl-ACP methyl ester carboxylesterase